MKRPAVVLPLASFLAVAALLAGCAAAPTDRLPGAAPPTSTSSGDAERAGTSPFAEGSDYAAEAVKPAISVHETPGGAVVQTFTHPQASGAPLNFLVKGHDGDWLEVYLPTRPNGVTGWILGHAVAVREMPYRLEVSVDENTMALFEDGELTREFSVATGTGGTPTPLGTFYLTELIAPTNPGYGPYAYGLSAFSEVLNTFGGGPGQIGLHGTDDASSIGTAASHGCIRLSNEDITELAGLLPLGTSIVVRA